jgi:hypothetical protein
MEVRLAAELAIERACSEGRRVQIGSLYMPRVVDTECHRHAGQARVLKGAMAQRNGGLHWLAGFLNQTPPRFAAEVPRVNRRLR